MRIKILLAAGLCCLSLLCLAQRQHINFDNDWKFQFGHAANPEKDFNYSIATIFSWFAIVAMLLTATGLFALVSLTVMKKMKEIAVRKVMGARPRQIISLLNKGYIWIFLVAAVIGCYAGWFLTRLMMDSIFGINVGVEVSTMIFAVVALFLISALTVGFKVWQAVRANPAEVLKTE